MKVVFRVVFKFFLKPLLFSGDPERMHDVTSSLFAFFGGIPVLRSLISSVYSYKHPALKSTAAGIDFDNPVGLAAGFDKQCTLIEAMPRLGFGFLEVGTITAKSQDGNLKPRLFRLSSDNALINRMGFNNVGADTARRRLMKTKKRIPIGINIGKSQLTPLHEAVDDYVYTFRKLSSFADYVVVNVSSPNSPGLRSLQDKSHLLKILRALQRVNTEKKPIFVKIAPDLTKLQVDDIIAVAKETRLTGIIATNTTTTRDGLREDTKEEGGLSGRPITKHALEHVAYIAKRTRGKLVIIGVGGIFTAQDAYAMIKAGASLIQVYTGMIYEGPAIVKRINKGLVKLLREEGFSHIQEAVGSRK